MMPTINPSYGLSSRKRRLRGMTMLEVIIGMSIMAMVLFGATLSLLVTLSGWTRGQARISAEMEANQALRLIMSELREAAWAQVDVDGRGITYRHPATDVNGNYLVPIIPSGVDRRFFVNVENEMVYFDGTSDRVILRGVILQDPNAGMAAYMPFIPGAGTVTRVVIVQVATSRANRGEYSHGRLRERIILRNVPDS